MRRKSPWKPVLLIAVAVAAMTYGTYSIAEAGHVAAPYAYAFLRVSQNDQYSDSMYNWDSSSSSQPTPYNVDWPVDMLFYNGAEIDLVKAYYQTVRPYHTWCGSGKYLTFWGMNPPGYNNDPAGLFYDGDGGIKDNCAPSCLTPAAYHMRLYADPNDDMMYNTYLGFYVVGTTHKDANEWPDPSPCNKWHGNSEFAEQERFAPDAREFCPGVFEDFWPYYNEQYGAEIGNHIVYNDGWATYVNISRLCG